MGKNIADFVDPDIEEKLLALEREEEMRVQAGVYDNDESVSCLSVQSSNSGNNFSTI